MSILTIARLPNGNLLIGGSGQEVAISASVLDQREAAREVARFVYQDCSSAFLEALTRNLIALRAEKDMNLRQALGADPDTRYLLELPT